MVPDGRTDGMDGRTDGQTDGRTDDAKTISLRLRRGIKNIQATSTGSDQTVCMRRLV